VRSKLKESKDVRQEAGFIIGNFYVEENIKKSSN